MSSFNIWKNDIGKLNVSTITKNNYYKFLRAILNHAIKYHNVTELMLTLNKMTSFNTPNKIKKEMRFYTYEEFKKFIDKEDDLKYKCFFQTLYYCGLRKGEANALIWKDVDFERKTLSINKNANQKIKGKRYVILTPKTKGSIRVLPMPKVLLNNIKILKN